MEKYWKAGRVSLYRVLIIREKSLTFISRQWRGFEQECDSGVIPQVRLGEGETGRWSLVFIAI